MLRKMPLLAPSFGTEARMWRRLNECLTGKLNQIFFLSFFLSLVMFLINYSGQVKLPGSLQYDLLTTWSLRPMLLTPQTGSGSGLFPCLRRSKFSYGKCNTIGSILKSCDLDEELIAQRPARDVRGNHKLFFTCLGIVRHLDNFGNGVSCLQKLSTFFSKVLRHG